MKKLVLVVLLVLCGLAAADGSGANGSGAPAAGAPMPPPPGLEVAKQQCTAAINDPTYKESIRNFLDQQLDVDTIKAHEDALHHVQKNENHVIYAYAALWVIAALLVGFLFLRQQALKTEIAALKRDLTRAEDKS
jgi:hypothetical protein